MARACVLLEGLRLRVKGVEFTRREIVVREGKGSKDRVTVLPKNLMLPLRDQLIKARRLHALDLEDGYGEVALPHALDIKYPRAGRRWSGQSVFPNPSRSTDPRTGVIRRHHLYEQNIQRAVKGGRGVTSPLDRM